MARGYQVGIASETKAFKQGVQAGVIDPLEDAQKELTEMGRNRGPDQLEQAMKDAQRATDDLKDETKRTADAIEDEYRDAYRKAKASADDFGDAGHEGFGKVKEGAQEVTQEIGSNLGEAVSSFRGDLSDLSQVGQDTLGGLAASVAAVPGFGIPAAIGLAAGAAGWGLMTQNQQALKEKQEEINELASKMAEAYVDSAGKAASAVAILAASNDQLNSNFDEVKKNAGAWGVDYLTAARAMSGSATDLTVVQAGLNAKQAEWNEVLKKTSKTGEETWHDNMDLTKSQKDLRNAVHDGKDAYDKYSAAQKLASEQAAATSKNIYEIATASGIATGKVDDLGNKIVELPDGTEVVIDAKTKTASQNVDAFENNYKTKFKNLSDYNNALIRSAGKVAVEIDKVGNKVVTLPSGKQIFIDAKTKKASEDVSKFLGDVNKKVDHLNGRDVALKAKTAQAKKDVDAAHDYIMGRIDEITRTPVEVKAKVVLDTSQVDNWTPRQITIPTRLQRPVAVIP